MSLKVSCVLSLAVLLMVFSTQPSANAQSVPCAAITQNPLVLESLLDTHSTDADSEREDETIHASELEQLRFQPIVIQPGDALYVEYRGKNFTIDADFANGDKAVFGPSLRSDEQWHKGILLLDIFHAALERRLVRLQAVARNPDQVLLRNIRIIRAGRPVFEFARLASYGKPQVKRAVDRQLPCVPFDEAAPVPNPRAVDYAVPGSIAPKGFSGDYVRPMLPPFPMMLQGTTTGTDGNHYKFTGKELDDESGLYNYGARYYGPALGRFVQADPLYLEMHRLLDPQQLNLYTYGRNNPTTFSDPTGLDITLGCKGAQANCDTAVSQLNDREKAQFKVGLDKNNKLTIQGKVDASKLSKAEKALYNAISDKENHAALNVVNQSGTVTFGLHDSSGVNTVDVADTAKLDAASNVGGLNAGDAVAHEGLQAYFSLFDDAQSDNLASEFFPGLNNPTSTLTYNGSGTKAIGSVISGTIADGRGSELIRTTFKTPIPAIDIFAKGIYRATQGMEREVDEVKFVPAKPK